MALATNGLCFKLLINVAHEMLNLIRSHDDMERDSKDI